jgi:hypothetical protein
LARGGFGALGLLAWSLKPQFLPWLIAPLLVGRQFGMLLRFVGGVVALSVIALAVFGSAGLGAYSELSSAKLRESLSADPTYLPGPTVLHLSQTVLGPGAAANVLAAGLVVVTALLLVVIWRRGLLAGDVRLVQLAALPIVAIVAAPYALVHELTMWLASFWLLFVYSATRPGVRAWLWWLTAGIWLAGNGGVVLPVNHGADVAALLGLLALASLAWLTKRHMVVAASKSGSKPVGADPVDAGAAAGPTDPTAAANAEIAANADPVNAEAATSHQPTPREVTDLRLT